MTIIVSEPGEGGTKKEVDIAHEVNCDVFGKLELE